jgi:hypothetical protein
MCGLANGQSLMEWWREAQAVGCVVGEHWAMPFSEIALVDLVLVADEAPTRPGEQCPGPNPVEVISNAIRGGRWVPPDAA